MHRLAPIAVKLNGAMAAMNPSSPRYTILFVTVPELSGLYLELSKAKWTLNRKKSIISQAESISAWTAVLPLNASY